MADTKDAERKKRRAAALALLLFSPWKQLRLQIAMASHDLDGYFDAVDDALDTGTVKEALAGGASMVPVLTKLIRASTIHGFQDGGRLVGISPGRSWIARADALAADRAYVASGLLLKTSKKWLKANPDNSFALSSARADRAAKFEAARGYYGGLQMMLSGYGMTKSWLTTSDNPCELCLENEDVGPIAMESAFPSDDDAPPLHLNCSCVLSVGRSTR